MAHVIEAEPKDILPGKTFRWIRTWVVADSPWTSPELASAWAREQGLDETPTEEQGFLFRKEDSLRVYIPERDTIYELGHRLEIQNYNEKVREGALEKLTSEERRVLGV